MGQSVEPSARRISSSLLLQKGACREQVELFIALGGDHLDLTEELCLEHAERFNWYWAAYQLLTQAASVIYYLDTTKRWWAIWNSAEKADRARLRTQASAFYRAWVSPENQIVDQTP